MEWAGCPRSLLRLHIFSGVWKRSDFLSHDPFSSLASPGAVPEPSLHPVPSWLFQGFLPSYSLTFPHRVPRLVPTPFMIATLAPVRGSEFCFIIWLLLHMPLVKGISLRGPYPPAVNLAERCWLLPGVLGVSWGTKKHRSCLLRCLE